MKIYSIMKSQAEALGDSLGEEPQPEVPSPRPRRNTTSPNHRTHLECHGREKNALMNRKLLECLMRCPHICVKNAPAWTGSVTSTLIPVYFGWYWRGLASIVIRDGRHVEKWCLVLRSDERGSSDVLHSSDRMHSPSRLPTRSSVENDLRIVVSYSSLECLFAHCRCV